MRLLAVLPLLVACSPTPTPQVPAEPEAARADAAIAARTPDCASPIEWLAYHSRDTVGEAFCQGCASRCPDGAMAWDFLRGDPLRFGCGELAAATERLVAMGSAAPVAEANIAWLQAATEICERQTEYRTAAHYIADIEAWFAARDKGTPTLPGKLFVDGAPATRTAFLRFLEHGGESVFQFSDRTPVRGDVAPEFWRQHFGGVTIIAISVSTGAPGLECVDQSGTDCEGYDSATFFIDPETKEIVGIDLTAAG